MIDLPHFPVHVINQPVLEDIHKILRVAAAKKFSTDT